MINESTEKRLQALKEELQKEKTRFDSIDMTSKDPRSFVIARKIISIEKEIEELSA